MEIKENKASNKIINYIQDIVKKIAFNSQKRKIERTNLNEKDKFIFFHKSLKKTLLRVSLESVHGYYDYGDSLSNEDKLDIIINHPSLHQYLKETEEDKKALFKEVVIELLSKNSDKDVYFKIKNNNKLKEVLLTTENFKIEWVSFLDEKDLFLFSEQILNKIGDVKGAVKDVYLLLGKNINIVPFIEHCLKVSIDKGYIRDKDLPVIYKDCFGSKLNDVKNINLKNIIKAFLNAESLLNKESNVNKTFAGVYLIDSLIYNLKDTKEICLERLDLMLQNECTENEYKENYLSYVPNPVELLKRNINFLNLFSYYSMKESEVEVFNYLKAIKNDEMLYMFFTKAINNTECSLLSKENLDIVISYRNNNKNKKLETLKKTINDTNDIKNIKGFENYYEMFKYLIENNLIDVDTRNTSIRALFYFTKLEETNDNKLKMKKLFLEQSGDSIRLLNKDELLGLIFKNLDFIPKNNDDYNDIKKKILKLSFINERVIDEWENKVNTLKNLTVSDIKESFKSKTFKETDAFMFVEQMINLEMAKDLNLNDEEDLSLIIKSLSVSKSVFELREVELVSNKKFIEMYFEAVSKSYYSISNLIIDKFDRNLLTIAHLEKNLKGFDNDSWHIKKFNGCPFIETKEFKDFIIDHMLTKGLNLGDIRSNETLNKILTNEVLTKALKTKNGRYSLVSHRELKADFIKENWDILFETCKDEEYPYFLVKSAFLCRHLNLFSSGKHEIIREIFKNSYYLGEDLFMSAINKSIDNIMTVIDVAIEDNCVDLLFKIGDNFNGKVSIFDNFFFNKDFADFMKEKYNITENYPLLNKTEKDIEQILLDYDKFTMKSDIVSVQEQVEEAIVKPVKKVVKVKKF